MVVNVEQGNQTRREVIGWLGGKTSKAYTAKSREEGYPADSRPSLEPWKK